MKASLSYFIATFYLTFIWTVSPIEINDLIYNILYMFTLDKNNKMDELLTKTI